MINLENVDFDKETKEVRAEFGGFCEDGFYITCEVDWDENVWTPKDETLGIMEDEIVIERFTFCYFKIFNSANDEITFSKQMEREVKHEIENYITNKLEN